MCIRDSFSPDEQSIVPRAWHMAHGGGLDPHWFDYPSLPPFTGYRVVKLDLPLPSEDHPDPDRNLKRLRLEDVHYVVATGAVADRVLAAREDYPFESRFYDRLSKRRRVFYVAKDQDNLNGPWVAVYKVF